VLSKFIENAKEIEFDGVARDGKILNYAISEHVENAGVHSGDATIVLPAQKLYVETIRRIRKIAEKVAGALEISGPFNMQFMSKNNEVLVIECNLRSSRTFPFISKTFDFNFISLATKVFCRLPCAPKQFNLMDLDYVGCKSPMFSFTRLAGADPTLGVEMASTGEVACFGRDMEEAFLLSMLATGFKMPVNTRNILVSIGKTKFKVEFLPSARLLTELGYNLFATPRTHAFLEENGVKAVLLEKPFLASSSPIPGPNCKDYLSSGKIDLVINIPEGGHKSELSDGYVIRRTAVDFGVGLLTNIKTATLFSRALQKYGGNTYGANKDYGKFSITTMDEFYRNASMTSYSDMQ
jgi:hypothetical protein